MSIGDAIVRGWIRAISHPVLLIMKWLLNILFAYLLLAPMAAIVSDHLAQSAFGETLETETTGVYLVALIQEFSGELNLIQSNWGPMLLLFLALNLFLNGGVLMALQRTGRSTLSEVISACRVHLAPLLITLCLSAATFALTVILPIHFLERLIQFLDSATLEKKALYIIYTCIAALVVLPLVVWSAITRKGSSAFAAKFRFLVVGLVLILLAVILPIFYLDGYFADIERRFPDERLIFQVYWTGVAVILLTMGTWALRVHHILRLRVCRPDQQRNFLLDPFIQWGKAVTFTTRHYMSTLVIWALFAFMHLAFIPLQNLLQSTMPQEYGFLAAQFVIGFRILSGFALMAAFAIYQAPRMNPTPASVPPDPTEQEEEEKPQESLRENAPEHQEPESSQPLHWIPEEPREPDHTVQETQTFQDTPEPERAVHASPTSPTPSEEEAAPRIEWIPMEEPEIVSNPPADAFGGPTSTTDAFGNSTRSADAFGSNPPSKKGEGDGTS